MQKDDERESRITNESQALDYFPKKDDISFKLLFDGKFAFTVLIC